ncbi:MAG TPA: hypothetical protein VKR60_01645 [Candidatus Sulfotelmatobacter sp.]|nr:hypothetical protein [Candidatus Sulfotelmatobacter sp.]
MNSKEIIAIIKEIRAEHFDRTFGAGPGTVDASVIESVRRSQEFVEEYDRLLALIEGEGAALAS